MIAMPFLIYSERFSALGVVTKHISCTGKHTGLWKKLFGKKAWPYSPSLCGGSVKKAVALIEQWLPKHPDALLDDPEEERDIEE
jgi:hypothetical protein